MLEVATAPWLEELPGLVGAVEISSDDSFSFDGVRHTGGAGNVVERLTATLYHRGYCNRYGRYLEDDGDDTDLGADLSAANASRTRSYSGWRIEGVDQSGRIDATRSGVRRSFQPGEYLTLDGQGVPPHAGGTATVHLQRESADSQSGYYFAFGEALADDSESTIVRLYWNVVPSSAAALLGLLTRDLNAFEVPFRYKSPALARAYTRRDAAVLYVSARYFDITAQLAARWARDVRITLRSGVPLFAKPMAPGVGFAEDPGNGESFGTSRCRTIAEAIVGPGVDGGNDVEQKLEAVRARFAHEGLDLDRPFLNPCSVDRYPAFKERFQ